MLNLKLVDQAQPQRAAPLFHQHGSVALEEALSPQQLEFARQGAQRVVAQQLAATPLEEANRGFARYSFGSQLHHPEWAQLVDLPTVLPALDAIWGGPGYICMGAGGDYSVPGAKIQQLHSDLGDFFADPLGQVSCWDVPAPFIVVNFLLTEFREINGAIRFIPGTHRTRLRPPGVEEEPEHWRRSILCAPAGTAVVRDVRCWHGGTANNSDEQRIMTSAGYYAPWFRRPDMGASLPRALYDKRSARGRELCRYIVDWEGKG